MRTSFFLVIPTILVLRHIQLSILASTILASTQLASSPPPPPPTTNTRVLVQLKKPFPRGILFKLGRTKMGQERVLLKIDTSRNGLRLLVVVIVVMNSSDKSSSVTIEKDQE